MLTLSPGTPPSKPGIDNRLYSTESSVHVRIPETELHIHTYTHTVYLSREKNRSGLQVVDLELQKLPDPSW